MRCEYQNDPLGIDTRWPRLSWEVSDGRRGAIQTAYQVLVASSLEKLGADEADVWDSGERETDQSHLVRYRGPLLRSARAYYWKVRTWDVDGQASEYSEPAKWEMGLLSEKDWKARGWRIACNPERCRPTGLEAGELDLGTLGAGDCGRVPPPGV